MAAFESSARVANRACAVLQRISDAQNLCHVCWWLPQAHLHSRKLSLRAALAGYGCPICAMHLVVHGPCKHTKKEADCNACQCVTVRARETRLTRQVLGASSGQLSCLGCQLGSSCAGCPHGASQCQRRHSCRRPWLSTLPQQAPVHQMQCRQIDGCKFGMLQ